MHILIKIEREIDGHLYLDEVYLEMEANPNGSLSYTRSVLMEENNFFEIYSLSSLSKVFADDEIIKEKPVNSGSAFKNETYSYQIAYKNPNELVKDVQIRIESKLFDYISVRNVGLAPSEFPCYHDHDKQVIRDKPGLYPDPLLPLGNNRFNVPANQWRSIWITIELNQEVSPDSYPINIIFEDKNGKKLGREKFKLKVLDKLLPEQQLLVTQWFHTDCLATEYDVTVFSEQHWEILDNYVETLAKHGSNMILTPLFTPPLDTEVGKERPTVQLIDIEKVGEKYRFSFGKLKRWIKLCDKRGIKYFEFAHFFTQWGARCAPKIVATVNGKNKRIFGWETDSAGKEYRDFLSQFFPELDAFIKQQNLERNVYFHVSDEPDLTHLEAEQSTQDKEESKKPYLDDFETYKLAREIMMRYLSDYPFFDASSNYSFYEKGLIENPVPAVDHIDPYLKNKVPNLWFYYCRDQYKEVPNRFFNFPSTRNRIIGFLIYKFEIFGFLHWGYNFWYSELSRKQINPFSNTDGNMGYPSGDAFLVYPGDKKPIESIRLEVFFDAIQDLKALQLLESTIGRKNVINLIEEDLEQPLTFTTYPCNIHWLLATREKVNGKIIEQCK